MEEKKIAMPELPKKTVPKPPNDSGNIEVLAHFKIYDPKTKETIVEGRG